MDFLNFYFTTSGQKQLCMAASFHALCTNTKSDFTVLSFPTEVTVSRSKKNEIQLQAITDTQEAFSFRVKSDLMSSKELQYRESFLFRNSVRTFVIKLLRLLI